MRRRPALAWVILAALLSPTLLSAQDGYSLVVAGGRVMDPASGIDRPLNVGIRDGRIAALSAAKLQGTRTLDASGLVVSPGFIDILAPENPEGDRFKIADGVTTVISTHGGPVDTAGWYAEVAGRGAPLNYGTVVGHSSLRAAAGALDGNKPATPEQVATMVTLAQGSMDQGALGIGFGIEYVPGTSGQEITALAAVAARANASIHSHIRLPDLYDPFQGINELIAASALTGVRSQVVHIGSMCIGRQKEALALLDQARARKIDIAADVYPYDAWMAPIQSALFEPGWQQKYALDYRDLVWPATGETLTAESFARFRKQGGWVVCHQIPESEILLALRHPAVSVASDATIVAGDANHPRGAGTFARVLGRYVREQKALTLMEALRKMTLMPAQRMEARAPELKRKGRIAVGMDADLAVFDPAVVSDRADYRDPKQMSAGIPYVLVRGVLVIDAGRPVPGARPGKPVRGEVRR